MTAAITRSRRAAIAREAALIPQTLPAHRLHHRTFREVRAARTLLANLLSPGTDGTELHRQVGRL